MPKARKPATPTAASIDPTDPASIAKAQAIAKRVHERYHFPTNSAELDDLNQVAVVTLLEQGKRFDPSHLRKGSNLFDAFWGWVNRYIQSECAREALRLRGGGTFHTHRKLIDGPILAEPIGHDADTVPEIVELSEREWGLLEDGGERPDECTRDKPKYIRRDCRFCGKRFAIVSDLTSRDYCSAACETEIGVAA